MNITKTCVVSCPIDVYAGYGARARDFVKALIKAKPEWDVKILAQRWGECRWGYLSDHNETDLASRIIPNLTYKPNVWVQVTIPNEFEPIGEFNIGVTAAMETDISPAGWSIGVNRMDLTLVSSNHSKSSLTSAVWKDSNSGQDIKTEKPIEVLFEGLDINTFDQKPVDKESEVVQSLNTIKESFCFLMVGHWLQGDFGEDRKNIPGTIKAFLETFKNKLNPPALVIKTQSAFASTSDRNKVLQRISRIAKTVTGSLPNIYLLHGEIPESEIVNMYNHPKIKAIISIPKGEGFNRPLLEFTFIGKPVISTAWSGHTDFLPNDLVNLVGGQLTPVHPSAHVQDMIIPEAKWLTPDMKEAQVYFKQVFKDYKQALLNAQKLRNINRRNFSFDAMVTKLGNILNQYDKPLPQLKALNLPTLKRI